MPPDQRILDQLSLTREEYERIIDLLDREPTEVELGMFGAMWSEHCGYKNSRPLLKMFPSEGTGVLTKAGEENAGVIDIGDGLCVAFKIESHNHPSAIEPYEGAATGVGGIVRDIFAMGARPVALLDSLRFGPLQPGPGTTESDAARNRYLFNGVVAGIGGYGNCIGIPTVGGEVGFSPSYSGNPLVNAMCVGVARTDRLVKARADGPGNVLLLVGADTGRDGIHGATFASVQLDESSEERRPAVQVGNPFLEKLLMEACLQLTEEHHEWVVGLQDLGAAGLTSSTVECAAKAGTGLIIDVSQVPRREHGMTPYEVMLSESQERMLVIVRPEHEADVRALFERWELHCAAIGIVTDDGVVRVRDGDVEVAAIPAGLLTDAPTYVRDGERPRYLDLLQSSAPGLPEDADMMRVLLDALSSPEIASKRLVWRQYDHQVGTNTVIGPGSDAALIRIKGTTKALAVSTDGNAAYTFLDPYAGGALAVAEAARNVACTGARPIGLTNCLNFGNPEKPDVYFQLKEAIRGMADAARALGIPVISGNVSLYNEINGEAIWPTPVVGMVGVLNDVAQAVPSQFQREGDTVLIVGAATPGVFPPVHVASMAASGVAGLPRIDLDAERRMIAFLTEATAVNLLQSGHDVSSGGTLVALAESCTAELGAAVRSAGDVMSVTAWFAEDAPGVVISIAQAQEDEVRRLVETHGLVVYAAGAVTAGSLAVDGGPSIRTRELLESYDSGLARALDGVASNA